MLLTQITVVIFLIIGLKYHYKVTTNKDIFLYTMIAIFCIITCIVCISSYITFLDGTCATKDTPIPWNPPNIPSRTSSLNMNPVYISLMTISMSGHALLIIITALLLCKGYVKCYRCCKCRTCYNQRCCGICCPSDSLPNCICNCLEKKTNSCRIILVCVVLFFIVVINFAVSISYYLNSKEIENEPYLISVIPFFVIIVGIFTMSGFFISCCGSCLTTKQAIIWAIIFGATEIMSFQLNSSFLFPFFMLILYPIMIYFLFWDLKEFTSFSIHVLTLYASTFDYFTDILVIIYWFGLKQYRYAIIQILILVLSQALSLFSLSNLDKQYIKHNVGCQKYLLFFGLGRQYFTIKYWQNPEYEYEYIVISLIHIVYIDTNLGLNYI